MPDEAKIKDKYKNVFEHNDVKIKSFEIDKVQFLEITVQGHESIYLARCLVDSYAVDDVGKVRCHFCQWEFWVADTVDECLEFLTHPNRYRVHLTVSSSPPTNYSSIWFFDDELEQELGGHFSTKNNLQLKKKIETFFEQCPFEVLVTFDFATVPIQRIQNITFLFDDILSEKNMDISLKVNGQEKSWEIDSVEWVNKYDLTMVKNNGKVHLKELITTNSGYLHFGKNGVFTISI